VHELATNSLKYGALSAESGRLQVSVVQSAQDLEIVWSETGGQASTAPSACGFGTRLVNSMCTQLGASITRAWQPDGLNLTLSFPIGV
jgi:two-component sensor histidine kinase